MDDVMVQRGPWWHRSSRSGPWGSPAVAPSETKTSPLTSAHAVPAPSFFSDLPPASWASSPGPAVCPGPGADHEGKASPPPPPLLVPGAGWPRTEPARMPITQENAISHLPLLADWLGGRRHTRDSGDHNHNTDLKRDGYTSQVRALWQRSLCTTVGCDPTQPHHSHCV